MVTKDHFTWENCKVSHLVKICSVKLVFKQIIQTMNGPTLLTSAGAIVLLICSTALETPARDKQTMTDRQEKTMQRRPHR